MKHLKYLLLFICLILISATAEKCIAIRPGTCHEMNPESHFYCMQVTHAGIVLTASSVEIEALTESNIVIQINYPFWISYDHIGDPMEIILGSIDKAEKVATMLIKINPEKKIFSNKTELNIKFNYLQKELIYKFLDNLKDDSIISVSFGMNLGTMSLYSKESYVYENFPVIINLYSNANLYLSWQLDMDIAYLMVGYLRSTFKEIPDNAFSGNPDAIRNSMFNKLDALENMINAKNPQGAYQKLKNDIMSKFDGQNGGNSQDDWVSDPYYSSATYSFYNKILNLLDYLKS